jgi:hypothetical protein
VSAAAIDFCGKAVAEILFIHRLRFWISYVEVLANSSKLEATYLIFLLNANLNTSTI